MKVVVIEDALEVVESIKLCIGIRWPHSTVLATPMGQEGPFLIESEAPDVVLLDLALPDMDGLEVLQAIRRFSDVPVLIVTVRGDDTSRVKGLELGADDYTVKPFVHTELLARIKAVLRRSHHPELRGDEGFFNRVGLSIDLAAQRVFVNDREVEITASEWALLYYLVRNEGRIIPLQVLAENVWGSDQVESSAIKVCIRRLRMKLGDDARNPRFIRNHRGRGYSFEASK